MSSDRPSGQAPDMTVVIVTHNRPQYLRSALWGVTQLRGGAPPVIVVDDGSTPAAEIEGFEELDVQLVRNDPGKGPPAARNTGLALVTTPWVAFLDDDDIYLPWHLEGARRVIARAGAAADRVGLVYVPAIVTDPDRRVLGVIPAYPEADLARALYGGCPVPTPSAVVSRAEAIRELGGFDSALPAYCDWDMWLRVTRAGWTAMAAGEPSIVYLRHTQSMTGRVDVGRADLERMMERYGAEAARMGVRQPDVGYPSHVAQTLLAGGHRRRAARAYLHSFNVRHKPHDLVLATLALAGRRPPQWMRRVRGLPPEFPAWAQRLERFEAGDAVASG